MGRRARWSAGLRCADDFTRPLLICLWLAISSANGAEVGLAGVFPGKALLTIDGGPPRVVALGATTDEGVRVVAIDGNGATIEVDGQKRALRVGQNVAAQPSDGAPATAVLTADAAGHFYASGSINGKSVRFLVDTSASLIALGASDARRVGIDASRGPRGITHTANGQAVVVRARLDTVRVGEIVLNNVEAMVHQQDMPMVLLGMSFLNRMEMQRNGETMTLKKRY